MGADAGAEWRGLCDGGAWGQFTEDGPVEGACVRGGGHGGGNGEAVWNLEVGKMVVLVMLRQVKEA